ncbi:GAF domain-containing protein [Thermosipho japonicus]|uniref:GAF domain-containing protein n=1 Tax=Thermosipho japonicus TaxID=90323 RepID=A0A841GR44_9BACT|nr:GAF domain-containing protein [Thermosipho japonicus]MBB6061928.1 GAF domain-containing protein [Thermosipho japonicus]
MRNIVENHVEEILEILRYDKSQWGEFWSKITNKYKFFKKIEEKLGEINFDSVERRELDKLLNDFREFAKENKDNVTTKIRKNAKELELNKEDFIVFLGVYPKEFDWIVVDFNGSYILFYNVYSLWKKEKLSKLSEAVYQAIIHFRNGEMNGNYYDKDELFIKLLNKLEKESKDDPVKYMRKICQYLYDEIPYYDWVGFYMINKDNVLELFEFVGEPTEHVKINIGEGICGQAAMLRDVFIVQDVSKETNYLSCSPKVRSEIVVPIFKNKDVIGELDIDSHYITPFDDRDRKFLERICEDIPKIWDEKLFERR